jgi:ubiquinone/menaquinone biosynthesis C-methylase UbiE
MGEVDKIRDIVAPWLVGDGLDIGFGGNPINKTAICIDLPIPYSNYGAPRHLTGNAVDLFWFSDSVLDYIFSSHLLEDFKDTEIVLHRWMRVLKPYGVIALYLPDEQKYRRVMLETGGKYNQYHQIEDMSLEYMKSLFRKLEISIVYEYEETEPLSYGFLIVGRK